MTRWTPSQRADAIGRALVAGADVASEATGIPRRTISSWLSGERSAPELQAITVTTNESILETLRAASAEAAADLLRIIRDPKAADRDKVRASEVVLDRYNLLSGGATARTESANLNFNADAKILGEPFTHEGLRAHIVELLALIENSSDADLAANEAKVQRMLGVAQNLVSYDPHDDEAKDALRDSIDRALVTEYVEDE